MKFKLEIECNNEAFGDEMSKTLWELGRMLYALSKRLRETAEGEGEGEGKLRDSNGNTVGKYWFEGERE